MSAHRPVKPTSEAERLLEALAAELTISPARVEAAERSYRSLGDWLNRDGSALASMNVEVYAQGSFRLGTVIKPASDEDDYDLDVVCEIDARKSSLTQKDLKLLIGREIAAYARAHGMDAPEEGRRCWTMVYAAGAQFHMDVLPALPDGTSQARMLEEASLDARWSADALAITDREHQFYALLSSNWPSSNPRGYGRWFMARIGPMFAAKRQAQALIEQASVEDIPEHRVRTPLQDAIKILKRHRDVSFEGDPDDRPISIILTTLAARAYEQETSISDALLAILSGMDRFIEKRGYVEWVSNPADPRENFADKWVQFPERRRAFYEWLETARADFNLAAQQTDLSDLIDTLAPRMGRRLVETAASRGQPIQNRPLGRTLSATLRNVLDAPHRKPPTWPIISQGSVRLSRVVMTRDGYRPTEIQSDGPALPKRVDLRFEATTDVPGGFRIFWQVVNTGREAEARGQLRGGFEERSVERGNLTKSESTFYSGTHSIECFVVKDGYCVARSGPFIVNIA